MMIFEYQYEDGLTKVRMELPSDSLLSEVLEQFENFLRASGYSFDGEIDIYRSIYHGELEDRKDE